MECCFCCCLWFCYFGRLCVPNCVLRCKCALWFARAEMCSQQTSPTDFPKSLCKFRPTPHGHAIWCVLGRTVWIIWHTQPHKCRKGTCWTFSRELITNLRISTPLRPLRVRFGSVWFAQPDGARVCVWVCVCFFLCSVDIHNFIFTFVITAYRMWVEFILDFNIIQQEIIGQTLINVK